MTVHDLAVLREPSWFPAWSRTYGRALMPRAVRGADRVICVSRATARDVVGLLDVPHRNIRVIPNAIEPVFSQPPGPPPLEQPYLLCVGTPEPRKNLPALLDAFDLVRSAGRRVRLALVGADGWGEVTMGTTEGVVAFGRIDDTELRDLYAHSEALVLPSLWEGFGLPVGEALAAGARVACSDLPALREMAGEDATYFDPTDPEAIADGILEALSRPRPMPRRGSAGTTWPARWRVSGASWLCESRAVALPQPKCASPYYVCVPLGRDDRFARRRPGRAHVLGSLGGRLARGRVRGQVRGRLSMLLKQRRR